MSWCSNEIFLEEPSLEEELKNIKRNYSSKELLVITKFFMNLVGTSGHWVEGEITLFKTLLNALPDTKFKKDSLKNLLDETSYFLDTTIWDNKKAGSTKNLPEESIEKILEFITLFKKSVGEDFVVDTLKVLEQ